MKILIGVSGSISAYKALDVVRGLTKNGHEVKVIVTSGATKFVVPEVFLYLGALELFKPEDDFKYPSSYKEVDKLERNPILHIDLARWADQFAILPLSANTLSSLNQGSANDLLTSVFLATNDETPIVLYPAMNQSMLKNPLVQRNLNSLRESLSNVYVIEPDSGLLACGEEGSGKLPDVDKIIETLPFINTHKKRPVNKPVNKKVLITTGATISPLDPVRFLTNSSSGLTGFYLAREALKEGLQVKVIAGKAATSKLEYLNVFPNFEVQRVVSPSEMSRAVLKSLDIYNLYISSAAIGDIEFVQDQNKIKKANIKDNLPIKQSPDILAQVLKEKPQALKTVGFAAETDLSFKVLNEKWERKPVDLLVGTKVHNGLTSESSEVSGFSNDSAYYSFMENKEVTFEGSLSKKSLAQKILQRFLRD